MSQNPFQTPSADPFQISKTEDPSSISEHLASSFKSTKNWVMFIAILLLIAGGFSIIGGFGISVFAFAGGGMHAVLIGLLYLISSVIYILPGYWLLNSSLKMGAYASQRSNATLIDAVQSQQTFWKGIGILFLVCLVIYILVIMGFVGFAVVGSQLI